MSRPLVFRQNRLFKIDASQLPQKANTSAVINGLYADLYIEFSGAEKSDKYGSMDLVQRMNAVNAYAQQWLLDRGFTNE